MATVYWTSTGSNTADSISAGGYYYSGSDSTAGTVTYSSYWYPTYTANYSYTPYSPSPETEEQKQARLEQQRQYDIKQERIKKEQEKAKQKADELLKSYIGIEALGELFKVGYIELDSQKYKGRKYRVASNARSLIEVLDGDRVIDRLCVHPDQRYQDSDEILTRMTLLQYAEEYLLKTANHHRVAV